MREYFTIMVKENDTSNLKLLTDKLNEGFYIDDRIEVGRSTLITLQRRPQVNLGQVPSRPIDTQTESVATSNY